MEFIIGMLKDEKWNLFIEYAFQQCTHFSLTKYDFWKIPKRKVTYDYIINELSEWLINKCYSCETETEIFQFKCNHFTKKIIKEIGDFSKFNYPDYPEDLSFYKGEKLWMKSITHHGLVIIYEDNPKIISDLNKIKIL